MQVKEEESYYYEYPYYEDLDGNPHQSQTYTDTTEKEVKVAPPTNRSTRSCAPFPTQAVIITHGVLQVTGDEDGITAAREVLGGTSSKVTISSSSSSSSDSTADGGAKDTYGEDTDPYGDNYDNYGPYTYYDEVSPSPDTPKTVSVSVDSGSVVDLGLAGKIELGAGTGAGSSKVVTSSSGSSMTINSTKLVVSGRPERTRQHW